MHSTISREAASHARDGQAEPSPVWLLLDSCSAGGIERHVSALAKGLAQAAVPVEIVLLQQHVPNAWCEGLERDGLTYRCIDGSLTGLAAVMRRERPALVHTHGHRAGLLGRTAASLCGVPIVSTFHSGEPPGLPLAAWMDRWTSYPGERIVVSEGIGEKVPFAASLIPHFIDPPEAPPAHELPRQIAFVGPLLHEAAPDWFCEIAVRSSLDVEWCVYGDGPMRGDLLERYADRVIFHGSLPDMTAVWSQTGLLLLPSRTGDLPYAALEAHAAGVPVAASRGAGPITLLNQGSTGWLFEPGDLRGAAAAVESWSHLTREEQIAWRHRCWGNVCGRFSTATWIGEILTVYGRAGWIRRPAELAHIA
jgi:glycosyltransferase involved in cell wall biosynthesis